MSDDTKRLAELHDQIIRHSGYWDGYRDGCRDEGRPSFLMGMALGVILGAAIVMFTLEVS